MIDLHTLYALQTSATSQTDNVVGSLCSRNRFKATNARSQDRSEATSLKQRARSYDTCEYFVVGCNCTRCFHRLQGNGDSCLGGAAAGADLAACSTGLLSICISQHRSL